MTELTIRMLGDNVTLSRTAWDRLAALLNGDTPVDRSEAIDLASRITDRLLEADTALDAYPVGTSVTTIVASIGGREERVTGHVVGRSFGSLVVSTPCHGRIVVALDRVI